MRMNTLPRDIFHRRGAVYKPGGTPINVLEKRACKLRPYLRDDSEMIPQFNCSSALSGGGIDKSASKELGLPVSLGERASGFINQTA